MSNDFKDLLSIALERVKVVKDPEFKDFSKAYEYDYTSWNSDIKEAESEWLVTSALKKAKEKLKADIFAANLENISEVHLANDKLLDYLLEEAMVEDTECRTLEEARERIDHMIDKLKALKKELEPTLESMLKKCKKVHSNGYKGKLHELSMDEVELKEFVVDKETFFFIPNVNDDGILIGTKEFFDSLNQTSKSRKKSKLENISILNEELK